MCVSSLPAWAGVRSLTEETPTFITKSAPWLNLDKDESYTFPQDGAASHMSNSTEVWLEKNLPGHWEYCGRHSWAASSPDLSIIENVWAIL